MLAARARTELTTARVEAGLSIVSLARETGLSKSALSRLLAGELRDLGVIKLSEVASVLGFESYPGRASSARGTSSLS